MMAAVTVTAPAVARAFEWPTGNGSGAAPRPACGLGPCQWAHWHSESPMAGIGRGRLRLPRAGTGRLTGSTLARCQWVTPVPGSLTGGTIARCDWAVFKPEMWPLLSPTGTGRGPALGTGGFDDNLKQNCRAFTSRAACAACGGGHYPTAW